MAPFEDVVAPFCLYQCKHNEASNVQNTYWITEFDKCGLLITSNTGRSKTGWIVTTILMKVWQNKLKNYKDIDLSPKQNKQYLDAKSHEHYSYPEILFRGQAALDPQHYVHANYRKTQKKWFIVGTDKWEEELVLNPTLSPAITIVQGNIKLSISKMQLHKDGTINEGKLNPTEKKDWSLLKNKVKVGVSIQFFLG